LSAEADVLKFAEKLRGFNEPLSLDEIAERLKMNRGEVGELMWKLVKMGVVKAFFKENSKGELEAKYIIL
jgi:DNA-binding transcriptional regulator GbsR (MarR family)